MTYFSASVEDVTNDSSDQDGLVDARTEQTFPLNKYIFELRADIGKLDPLVDSNYRLIIELMQNPLIGIRSDEWANLLCVSQMTIKRWGKGGHLPYPIPRKGFVAEILDRLDRAAADQMGIDRCSEQADCY